MELGSHVNAGTMTKLHIDVFTENETSLKITPISTGKEFLVSLAPLVLSTWNSFDIALTSFTGVVMSDVFQFKFEGSGGKTVYIDNLYFHNGTTAVSELKENVLVSMYPNPVQDQLNIKSALEINQVIVRNLLGQNVKSFMMNSREASIDLNGISAGNYFITLKLANGQSSTQKFVKL
jgi:hypothetical protein